MTRSELLLRMKVNMLEYLVDQRTEIELISDEDLTESIADLDVDREAVEKATTLRPIFDAMHSWDAPAAILFVFRSAISDPENIEYDDRQLPMRWDT